MWLVEIKSLPAIIGFLKMKNIIELDCRISKNKEIIQNELRKIKPFMKCSIEQDIELEKLEKCIRILCRNYDLFPKVFCDCISSDDGIIWSFSLVDNKNLNEIAKCYGITLYEVMCKAVIMSYGLTRKRKKEC